MNIEITLKATQVKKIKVQSRELREIERETRTNSKRK
jgi:hypothetical protein